MAQALRDLAQSIDQHGKPHPRCTGEDIALHLVCPVGPHVFTEQTHTVTRALADLAQRLYDWTWGSAGELLLEDQVVLLMLLDDALDGIDDPDKDVHQYAGIVDLRPDTRFRPFRTSDTDSIGASSARTIGARTARPGGGRLVAAQPARTSPW
ncbi:hypothetical protein [Streptomyces longisporoflavus]|uniref:Uncharacterized protein n=1 Tax=Streptomyces longisporoflavus TaxID=28044 RepID=A0ABW7QGV9_9ACTN